MEPSKRSKCLITRFAILPLEKDKSDETIRILNDLSRGNKDQLHLQKQVYLPENQKDDLFGTMMAVCDLKQKSKFQNEIKKQANNNDILDTNKHYEDDFWYLEIAGKEILYHKHECLIRNVDFIPISSNYQSLLLYLGHKPTFSFIQKGIKYYIPHYGVTIHIYSIEQIFDNNVAQKAPLEKDKQIIEMFIEVKGSDNIQKTEQKLLNFSKIFDHLHWFKIQPSSCKRVN